MQGNRRWWLAICSLLLVPALLTGCSSSSKDSGASPAPAMKQEAKSDSQANAGMKPAANQAANSTEGGTGALAQVPIQRKMIYTINMGLKVTDPDKAMAEVESIVARSQGYLSNMNRNATGYAKVEIRIPSNVLGEALTSLKELGKVSHEQKTGQDVTEEYVDAEARIKTLRVEEERLLELLKKAVKLEDILVLEKELSRVRGDLEKVQGRLKLLDNKIDYATIQLDIQKADALDDQSPQGTFGRAGAGLVDNVRGVLHLGKEAFIMFASNLFTLLILLIVGWFVYRFGWKKYWKKFSQNSDNGNHQA